MQPTRNLHAPSSLTLSNRVQLAARELARIFFKMFRSIPPRAALWLAVALLLSCLGVFAILRWSEESPGPMADGGDWQAVFADEFSGGSLDTGRWTSCYWWNEDGCTNLGNNELQWYVEQGVEVSDGVLRLIAREQDIDTPQGEYAYTSGMVTTGRYGDEGDDAFSFTHGYVEVRAKAPAGQGLWPAIWMLPSDQRSTPEIDIMEVLGHATDTLEMHYHVRVADEKRSFGSDAHVVDLSADWNVFGVEWSEDAIIWFLNGEEMWRFEDRRLISDEPMYLLINLAVGGDWPGDPDEDTRFPATFDIDYVRIWQRAG